MNAAIWLVALPLLSAFLLPLAYRRLSSYAGWIFPGVLAVNFFIAIGLWQSISAQGPQTVVMGGFPAPLGIVFYLDWLALLLVLALNLFTLILAFGHWRGQVRVETLLLLTVGGGSGLVLSGDLFNVYVFYEIVAVASYGLSAANGKSSAYAAALRYLLLGALGSALALLGIALIYSQTGTLNLAHLASLAPQLLQNGIGVAAFMLLLIGFGVKAELFPVNTWVPEVYSSTDARVAALLAGVVSKLSLVVILRLLVLIYGDSTGAQLLFLLGVLGVLTGELAAFRAPTLRQALAYSSIGQLGVMAVAFSIPGPAGIAAGLALVFHHLLVKSAFFLLTVDWGGPLERLRGAAWKSPLAAALFVLLALSLIGVPPLPGFWAKFLLIKAALLSGGWYHWALLIILGATVIETLYLMRVARLLYSQSATPPPTPRSSELRPALLLGALLLLPVLMLNPLSRHLDEIALQSADSKIYVQQSLPAFESRSAAAKEDAL